MQVGQAAEIMIIGIKTLGRLALGARYLGLLKRGGYDADDRGSYLVLKLENIIEPALETICPEMCASRSV
jgi:hypothetical protein